MEEDKERLSRAIESLAQSEAKSASAWWTFLRGAMYGLGFFIGSAILAAVVILILSKLQNFGSIGSFIHDVIQNAGKSKS